MASAAIVLGLAVWPQETEQITPDPLVNFANARSELTSYLVMEGYQETNPACRGFARSHDERTKVAIVLLHGFTNCPQQFRSLAERYFELGHNVFVPRMPRHGLADRLNEEQGQLTASELVASTSEAIDIAEGLGDEVVMVGFSLGATVAAWVVQERDDTEVAVIVAPLLSVPRLPSGVSRFLAALLTRLPNYFLWWDPRYGPDLPGPPHAYPRFGTRGLGAIMKLGAETMMKARDGSYSRARRTVIVINEADRAVSNEAALELFDLWRDNGASDVSLYRFEESLGLLHDLVDEQQVGAGTELVYPILIELATRR